MSEATLPMKLSPREEAYVRHWMYEEFHCNDPSQPRPAVELLEEHSGTELDLLRLIIAAICPIEGYDLAATPRPEGTPEWPWSSKGGIRGPSSRSDKPDAKDRGRQRRGI